MVSTNIKLVTGPTPACSIKLRGRRVLLRFFGYGSI
jgi:hypothetical protein